MTRSKAEPKPSASVAKRPVGRPLKFTSPAELRNKVEEYFQTHDKPSISEMSIYLGFVDRQSFYDYEQRSEFSDTIKWARTKLVSVLEKAATYGDRQTGPIFMLKNFGYSDKIDIQQDINEKKEITITVAPEIGSALESLKALTNKEELKVIEHIDEDDSDD